MFDIFGYLDKLRKKPVHTRQTILLVSTAAITGIIFTVWLIFWTAAIARPAPVTADSQTANSGAAPLILLKDNALDLKDSISTGFSQIKDQVKFQY